MNERDAEQLGKAIRTRFEGDQVQCKLPNHRGFPRESYSLLTSTVLGIYNGFEKRWKHMPSLIRDNLREWLSEEVAARARVTEEDLSPDYEPEPEDVVYSLKPVNGRFRVNCPSQIDIFNLQEGNRSQRQGSQRRQQAGEETEKLSRKFQQTTAKTDWISNGDSICGGIRGMGSSPLGNKSPLQPSENASDEEQEKEQESGESGESGEGNDEVGKEDGDTVSSPWTNRDILFVQSGLIKHGPIG